MKCLIFTFFVLGLFLCAPMSAAGQDDVTAEPRKENPSNLDARATQLTKLGNFRDAAAVYLHLIELYPNDVDLYVDLSRCRLELHEYQAAVDTARIAVKLAPENHAARNNLGWGLVSLGKTESGIVELKRGIELQPAVAPIRTNLGLAYLKLGRDIDAISELRAAIALDPYSARAKTALAIAYQRAGWNVLACLTASGLSGLSS